MAPHDGSQEVASGWSAWQVSSATEMLGLASPSVDTEVGRVRNGGLGSSPRHRFSFLSAEHLPFVFGGTVSMNAAEGWKATGPVAFLNLRITHSGGLGRMQTYYILCVCLRMN